MTRKAKQTKPKIQAETNRLLAHFKLKWRGGGFPLLVSWIQIQPAQLDEPSEAFLQRVEFSLEPEIDSWLEEELTMNLLAPISTLSDLKEPEKMVLPGFIRDGPKRGACYQLSAFSYQLLRRHSN